MRLFLTALFGIIFSFLQQTPAFADLSYTIHETARTASVNRDFETSFKLYFVLAKRGNFDAQIRVSQFYAAGEGVKQDYVQAYMWGRILSNGAKSDQQISGMKTTIKASMNKYLTEISAKMSSEQVEEAEKLASEWKPSERLEVTPEIAYLLGPAYRHQILLHPDIHTDQDMNRFLEAMERVEFSERLKRDELEGQEAREKLQKEINERMEREELNSNSPSSKRDKVCFENADAQAGSTPAQGPTEVQKTGAKVAGFDELKMQRLGCFGSCPIYDLTIKGDGRLWYQGNGNVDVIGLVKTTLSSEQLFALAEAIKKANFPIISKLDFSRECLTDSSTAVISLAVGCDKYVTNHYHGNCLSGTEDESLTQLEFEIDRIVNVEQWTGSSQVGSREFGRRSLSVPDQIRRFNGMAEEGDVIAQRNLGVVYNENCGERGHVEAVKWWTRAAEQGDGQAQNMLANAYADGKGVEQNYQAALDWLKKSAEKEYSNPEDYQKISAVAQHGLGYLYESGLGVTKDKAEAYYWYMRAADNFNVQDWYSSKKERYNNDRSWLEKSMPELMQVTRERVNSAKNSLLSRAEQGDAVAQYGLGLIYYDGEGAPKSPSEALKWLRKSSEQGYREAQVSLGLLYASDQEGVPYEPSEAVFWLQLGKRNAGAQQVLEREMKRMTTEQIESINKRISEWKPIQSKPVVAATPDCNSKEISTPVPKVEELLR